MGKIAVVTKHEFIFEDDKVYVPFQEIDDASGVISNKKAWFMDNESNIDKELFISVFGDSAKFEEARDAVLNAVRDINFYVAVIAAVYEEDRDEYRYSIVEHTEKNVSVFSSFIGSEWMNALANILLVAEERPINIRNMIQVKEIIREMKRNCIEEAANQ